MPPLFSAEVKEQYEELPYPPRDPADELERLTDTTIDVFSRLNFYGFRGRQSFRNGFRVLVAGGGTGDGAIHLAEQLRGTDGTVVYLDLSGKSMAIAQERAEIRGLTNIEWHKRSLLELPDMELAPFDYINCCGVLHHLKDRDAGLRALVAVLKEDGVIGLVVYSRHARASVYQTQELLRLVNSSEESVQQKLENAKIVLANLPPYNLFKLQENRHEAELALGDAALYDLLLHSQDEPFSVLELYDCVERAGLKLIEFVSPLGQKMFYEPRTFIQHPALLAKIHQLPKRNQQAIADLIGLTAPVHAVYLSRWEDTIAARDDPEMVPYFFPEIRDTAEIARDIADQLQEMPDGVARLSRGHITFSVPNSPESRAVLAAIDGEQPVADILDEAAAQLAAVGVATDAERLKDVYRQLFDVFNHLDWMLVRHKAVGPFKTGPELQEEFLNTVR